MHAYTHASFVHTCTHTGRKKTLVVLLVRLVFSGGRFVSNLLSHQFSFRALFQSRVLRVVLKQSAAVALLSGAITSIVYHFNVWEIFRQDDPAAFIASDEPLHTERVRGFTTLTSSYKFFPSFLLLGYLSYMIVR